MKERARYDGVASGRRIEWVGYQGRSGVGLISAISAGVRDLFHPRTRKKVATETRAKSGRARSSGQDLGASQSSMDAGLTGGMTLLLGGGDRRRR